MGARVVPYDPDRPSPNAPSPEQTEERLRDLEARMVALEAALTRLNKHRCLCRE